MGRGGTICACLGRSRLHSPVVSPVVVSYQRSCNINLNFATMPIVANGASNGLASNGAAKSNGNGVRRMTVQVSDKFGPTVNSAKFGGGGTSTGYTQSTFSTRGEAQKSCGNFLAQFSRMAAILLQLGRRTTLEQGYRLPPAGFPPNCPDN